MNYQHKFKEEEIPYGILKKFGLTREGEWYKRRDRTYKGLRLGWVE